MMERGAADSSSNQILFDEEDRSIAKSNLDVAKLGLKVSIGSALLNALVIAAALLIPARQRALEEYDRALNERYQVATIVGRMVLFYKDNLTFSGGNSTAFLEICGGKAVTELQPLELAINSHRINIDSYNILPSLAPERMIMERGAQDIGWVIDSMLIQAKKGPPLGQREIAIRTRTCDNLAKDFVLSMRRLAENVETISKNINEPVQKSVLIFDQPEAAFTVNSIGESSSIGNGMTGALKGWEADLTRRIGPAVSIGQ